MKKFVIGKDGFSLPPTLVTSTQAILARKRSGKSYTASVMAEEMLEQHQQVIVIDPTSAWYGLRSSADGESQGYPVVVFGGKHADAPLAFMAGREMAKASVEHGFSAIFDVGGWTTKEQVRFVFDFCSELLRINESAMHVFMDEADTFAPQKPNVPGQSECLGAVTRMVKQGGIKGIGFTMITQRSASISWDVLSQVDILTVLRMSAPHDLKPVHEWLLSETDADFAKQVKIEQPGLTIGTAFIASAPLGIAQKVVIRPRRTFNSGATPKPGERKIAPKVLAKIDIQKLGDQIAKTVQIERENSPEFLKKRITELEQKIAKGVTNSITPERERMLVQQVNELQKTASSYDKVMNAIYSHAATMQDAAGKIKESIDEIRIKPSSSPLPVPLAMPTKPNMIPGKNLVAKDFKFPDPNKPSTSDLTGPEQRIVNSIAWFHALGIAEPEKAAVAFMAGYTIGSGGFNNPCGSLNRKGLINYLADGRIKLTQEGVNASSVIDVPGTDAALQEAVLGKLGGPERRILEPLLKSYPNGMDNMALAAASGYAAGSGGYNNPRGRLKSLGLIRYESGIVYANSLLFPESN